MARDIQPRKGSQDTQAERVDLPKYEYQKDDSRSFSVSFYSSPEKEKSGESANSFNGMAAQFDAGAF
jgi:hypothetical protein